MTGPPGAEGTHLAPPSFEAGSAAPSPAPPVDRAAALAEGAPGIPAKFVFWVLGIALVVSLGGLLGEHLFSSAGLNPVPTTVPRAAATPTPATTPSAPTPAADRSLDAPLVAFMGVTSTAPHRAPAFALTDQRGLPTSVPAQPGRVIVLTFFNAPCNDICPVVAAELEQADAALGAAASNIEFVTVNTDPSALARSDETPSVQGTGLGSLPNWHMVTGSLPTLDSLWKSYGVSISVSEKTGLEAHNDIMEFIDPHGDLRYRATPFADESATGTFSLPAASIARWAHGIAAYAERIVGQ
jgi:cytochrome oxidase Cu insertion factor (SCO1/SenC/PrrC family)